MKYIYKVLLRNKNGKYEVINNNYNLSTYITSYDMKYIFRIMHLLAFVH